MNVKRALAIGLGLVVAITGVLALTGGTADARYKQPACGKFKKKIRKAKNRNQKLRARYNLNTCKKNRKVFGKVKNARFVGLREDGEPIDITLCANGKSADDVESEFKDVYRKGWRIEGAKFRGKYFEAGFVANLGGGGERVGALKRDKSGWQVGIYSLGQLDSYGPATRTDATKICKSL